MSRSYSFFAVAGALVLVGVLVAWLFLESGGQTAVLVAGGLALATQLPLHLALQRWRHSNDRFLVAIVLGFAARLAVLAVGFVLFAIPGRVSPAPFLVSLALFLVSLSLTESILDQRRLGSAKA